MSTRKILTAASVATVILGWGVLGTRSAPQAAQAPGEPPVISEQCKIVWADERIISSRIPGRLEQRLVEEGDRVNAEDVLAQLDADEAKLEFELQDLMGKSTFAIESAQEKLEEYRVRREKTKLLYDTQATSEEEWRLANVNVRVNDIQVKQEVEKRQLEQIKARRAKVILDDHTIKSPLNGVVQKCFKRAGESVPANDLQMFRIVAIDKVWVEKRVPESDWYRVRRGQPVRVQLVFLDRGKKINVPQGNLVFNGKVVFKDPDVDLVSRTFLVRAEVENQFDPITGDPILVAGLKADMEIVMGQPAPQAPQANAPAKKVTK